MLNYSRISRAGGSHRAVWHGYAALLALAEEAGDDELADSYGQGALIEQFEHEVAGLLGKEAAVFLPSGTMAQQIALRIWSERRGHATIAYHPLCHLEVGEAKGYERLHSLHARLVGHPRRLLSMPIALLAASLFCLCALYILWSHLRLCG